MEYGPSIPTTLSQPHPTKLRKFQVRVRNLRNCTYSVGWPCSLLTVGTNRKTTSGIPGVAIFRNRSGKSLLVCCCHGENRLQLIRQMTWDTRNCLESNFQSAAIIFWKTLRIQYLNSPTSDGQNSPTNQVRHNGNCSRAPPVWKQPF